MNNMLETWTKQELEVYINYCKLNNLKYECIWVNMEEDELEFALKNFHKQMLIIDKLVKIYLDFEYIKTIRYSLMDFVKEELPGKLLTWIPNNFDTKQDMAKFLDNYIEKELQFN